MNLQGILSSALTRSFLGVLFMQIFFYSVSASVNFSRLGDDFDHLIAHSMAYTLKDEVGCERKYMRG